MGLWIRLNKSLLKPVKHRRLTAANGEDAIAKKRAEKYEDAVIKDLYTQKIIES